jgi:DUF4097 and DUF4098 domain-containing protein YvlB
MIRHGSICAFLLLASCDIEEFHDSKRYSEEFHYSFNMNSGGRLDLETFNGTVEIYGWDQNKVEINGTKHAATKPGLEEIKIHASGGGDAVEVHATRPSSSHWSGGVRFRIQVPFKTRLDRIVSSNGRLRIEKVEGPGRLRTSNGPVKLLDHTGDVEVTTSNGPVDLSGFRGVAQVTTSNGPISVDALQLLSTSSVRLKTSNGPITVRLAANAGARVNAQTSNGHITADIPLSSVATQSKTHLEATIGQGGPLLDLHTSNGPIRITRN